MSYIRSTSKYRYVDAENPGDYIFPSSDNKGNIAIEDYGQISDATLLEFVCRYIDCDLKEMNKYIREKLAKRLDIKLKSDKK